MAEAFQITTPTPRVKLAADRRTQVSFTVANTRSRPLKARARVVAQTAGSASWFTLSGEAEQDFVASAVRQYAVQVAVPVGAAAGSYQFRLDVTGVANPDEDSATGPTVAVEVPPSVAPIKPFPWWIFVIAAVVAVVLVALIVWVIASQNRPPPAQVCAPTYALSGTKAGTGEILISSRDQAADGAKVSLNGKCQAAMQLSGGTPLLLLAQVPPGTYQIHISKPAYKPVDRTVVVVGGQRSSVDFALTPG